VLTNNFLQLAIRSRIKFFYRPVNLKENINTLSEKIQWVKNGENLLIKNPTPFYITISSIFQEINHQKTDLLKQGLMLSPFSEDQIKLKNSNITNMSFVYINDYGGRIEQVIRF
ncbi:fimbrial biogenesis chaperone, partial [Acinetobacter baumannii]